MYIIDHCALPTDKKAAPRSSNTTWVIWPPNETAAVTFLSTQHVGVKPFLKSHLYEKFLTSVQVIYEVDTLLSYYCIYYEYYLNRRYTPTISRDIF